MIGLVSKTAIEKSWNGRARSGKEVAWRSQCPRCLRWQTRETLLDEGCHECGWKSRRSKLNERK